MRRIAHGKEVSPLWVEYRCQARREDKVCGRTAVLDAYRGAPSCPDCSSIMVGLRVATSPTDVTDSLIT